MRIDRAHHDGRVTDQVVRQVKQGEEDQRRAQHPPEPPLLAQRVAAARPPTQLSDAAQAAVADGEQREEEAHRGTEEGIREALPGLTQQHVQGAHGAVAPGAGLDPTHTHDGCAEDQRGRPDRRAQQAGLSPAQQHQRAQRVHDGQVPVHANARDKEDAEVEVVVVEHPHSHAERLPQLPVQPVQVVVDEVRQGQQPRGVSQGQVEEEHRAAGPAQPVEENREGEQVEGKPKDHHRQEEGRHHVELDHR